nr:hypothetical protein Iba_chr13fCG12450 [Ipomoea batatas]
MINSQALPFLSLEAVFYNDTRGGITGVVILQPLALSPSFVNGVGLLFRQSSSQQQRRTTTAGGRPASDSSSNGRCDRQYDTDKELRQWQPRTSSSPFRLRRHTAEHVGGGPSSVRQWRCAAVGKNGPPCPVRLVQLVSDGELSGEDGSRRLSGEEAASTP